MTLICLASQKGSPGTTVTSLAVAAAFDTEDGRRKVMVEADCTGGTLAIRYRLAVEPGLLTLAAAVRGGLDTEDLWRHTQELPGGLPIVVCPDGPDQVHAAMSASGRMLGRFFKDLPDVDVICDVGRLAPDSPTLGFVAEASALLMVARPTAEQLQPAARRMMALRPEVENIGWVLVGEKPHSPSEVESTFHFPVVGVLADDQRAVALLEQGLMSKRIRRSPFVRSSVTLATTLSNWIGPATATGPERSDEADREPPREAAGQGPPDPAPPHAHPASPAPSGPESTSGSPARARSAPAPAPVAGGGPSPDDVALTGVPSPSVPVPEPPSRRPPVSAPAPVPPAERGLGPEQSPAPVDAGDPLPPSAEPFADPPADVDGLSSPEAGRIDPSIDLPSLPPPVPDQVLRAADPPAGPGPNAAVPPVASAEIPAPAPASPPPPVPNSVDAGRSAEAVGSGQPEPRPEQSEPPSPFPHEEFNFEGWDRP